MLKVKDGYAKVIGDAVNGNSNYLLLSNGGAKAVSDFAKSGHTHAYLPLTGGTLTGPLIINPSTITSGSDSTEILKIYSSTGYKSGLSISSTDNLVTINAKPFGTGTKTNALQINTYDNSSTVNAVRITAAGLVGIGTTTPGYKLEVNGTGKFANQLTLAVDNGTAPMVVTSSTLVKNLNVDLLDGRHFTDIQVGGRNYYRSQVINVSPNTIKKDITIHGYAGTTSGAGNVRIWNIGMEGIISNWTVSFYIKATTACKAVVDLCDIAPSGLYNEQGTIDVTSSYVKHTFTFLNVNQYYTSSAYNGFLDIYLNAANTIYVKDIKIERGTIATDWSLAPEDLIYNTISADSNITVTQTTTGVSIKSGINTENTTANQLQYLVFSNNKSNATDYKLYKQSNLYYNPNTSILTLQGGSLNLPNRTNNGTRAATYTSGNYIHGGEDSASYNGANIQIGTWYGFGIYPTIANQTSAQGKNSFWHSARDGKTYTTGSFYKYTVSSNTYTEVSYKGHTHTKSEITDFPASLPASGGNSKSVDGFYVTPQDGFKYVAYKSIDVTTSGTLYATITTGNQYYSSMLHFKIVAGYGNIGGVTYVDHYSRNSGIVVKQTAYNGNNIQGVSREPYDSNYLYLKITGPNTSNNVTKGTITVYSTVPLSSFALASKDPGYVWYGVVGGIDGNVPIDLEHIKSGNNLYLPAYDTNSRKILPNNTGIVGYKAVKPFFVENKNYAIDSGTKGTYGDFLVLDTYSDQYGGSPNALLFDKNNQNIWHFKGDYNGSTWNTGKRLAYASELTHNHDGTYLRLNGADTMTGALKLANNTWNLIGDDVKIGDHNVGGGLGIIGANGNTRLDFCKYGDASVYKSITFDGTNLYLHGTSYNSERLSNYAANIGDDKHKPFGKIPVIGSDGVTELGHYIDFHYDNTTDSDYSTRLQTQGNNSNVVNLPTKSGTLALTADQAQDSDKLDGIHATGLLTALSNSDYGVSITVGGTTRSIKNINVDQVDGYHASNIYNASQCKINNGYTTNDYIQIATIKIDGTNLASAGFTAVFSNRECLESSSFILTLALRRNSTTSVNCLFYYTDLQVSDPRALHIRSNDGQNFYVYFESVAKSWTTYYAITPLRTEGSVTFSNTGIAESSLIAGTVLKQQAVKGGYAAQADSATQLVNAIKFKDINGADVSYNGSTATDLTTGTYTAKLPYGFKSWTSGCTWGNTTGTSFASWNDSTGGSIDFRQNNPSSGKMSIKVDGRVYVNEGNNPVLSSESNNGFWGMRTPDGGNDWIRTSNNGLIPYVSGGAGSGHSSLGTSSWYFSAAYIDSIYGSLNGNSSTATKLTTSRTLWGQSFDGSQNVSGALTNTGTITPSATGTFNLGSNALQYSKVYAHSIVGESTSTSLYHQIAIGYPNHDRIDFDEYGGAFYFNQTSSGSRVELTSLTSSGITGRSLLFQKDNTYKIGSTTAEAAYTYTRQIYARHLNASAVYTGDKNLYIGYHGTANTYFYAGTNTNGNGTNLTMTITTGKVGIGTSSPSYMLSVAGSIYATSWLRTYGSTGWYSETYGGGWYMKDSDWVRVWNDRGIYTANTIQANCFKANTQNGAYLFGSSNAKISYLNNFLIFNTGDAIRFGDTAWDYDKWAGLKYVASSKTIYLGLADGTIFTKNAAVQTGGILNLVNINTLTTPASLTLSGATKVTSSAGLEIQGVIDGKDYATSEGYYTNAHNSIILRGDTTYGKSGILFTSSKGTTSINQTSDKGFIQFQSYGGTNTSGENNILLIGVGNDGTDSVYLQTPSVTGLKHVIDTTARTIPTNGDDNSEGLLYRHNNYQYTKTLGYPTATAQNTTAYSDYYVLRMRTYSTWDSTNSKSVNGGYVYDISNTVPNASAVGGYPANKLAKAYNNGGISLNDVAKSYGSFFGMTMLKAGTNYPNSSSSWFHIFQSSYNNQYGGSGSTSNYWVTQIVNQAGTTTPYIRSRAGGDDISTNWTDWKRILTEDEYPKLVIVNSNLSYATDGYANLTNGNVHLNLINPGTKKVISSGCIKGSGATTVTTDASGNIVVTSTNTNNWRDITDSYSGTSSTISLSQKGANDLYTALNNKIPTSLKNPNALSWSGYSSGSYDGSSAKSITIPNNTNQLTNGAGFITSSGSCTAANRLAVNKEFAKGNNFLQYFNTNGLSADTIGNAAPDNNWWHIIRMNHGNNAGYFSELAVALNSFNGVYWRTIQAGAVKKSWTRLANESEVLRYYDTIFATTSPLPNATPDATKNSSNLTLPTTTVWNKLGIRQFNNTFPDNLSGSIYNYGAVISLPGDTSRFDLYYSHQSCIKSNTYTDNGLYYRTGWGDGAQAASSYKYPWAKIIDSNNIGSQTVAKAGALTTSTAGSYNTPVYFTNGVPKACQTSIAGMFHVYGNTSTATVTDYLANHDWSNSISVNSIKTEDGYLMNGIKYYFELDTGSDTANNTTFIAFISNSQSDSGGVEYGYACNPRVRIIERAGDVLARVDFALYSNDTNFAVDIIVYKITTL